MSPADVLGWFLLFAAGVAVGRRERKERAVEAPVVGAPVVEAPVVTVRCYCACHDRRKEAAP